MNYGISPRQRRVFVLRWNPSISSFKRSYFNYYFDQYKGINDIDLDDHLDWNVWDWRKVNHRDLFVLMQVGQEKNGIVAEGFFCGFPYQYEQEDGTLSKSHFFRIDPFFMHKIENTDILLEEGLNKCIPEVDWQHGHSGEILTVKSAEKLGLFLVNELKNVDDGKDIYFDSFNEKKYVLADILTFMCPSLKRKLLSQGKNDSPSIKNVNNLMVRILDQDYKNWDNLEEHLRLEELNGILM